ncbi:MAG: glycogen debranching protein [Kiritimatiellae bacterium]|nr:glycogen debranching protein [Kiritimatiellia bacterium]
MKKTLPLFAATLLPLAGFALEMPFSVRGSYMAISAHSENDWGAEHQSGVWIRNVSNAANSQYVARIIPVSGAGHLEVTDFAESPEKLTLKTSAGDIEVAFADEDTILLRSENVGIRLDFWHKTWWHFIWEKPSAAGRTVGVATLYENGAKIVVDARRGAKRVDSSWIEGHGAAGAAFEAWNEGDGVEIALKDFRYDWDGSLPGTSFDEALARQRASFASFLDAMPTVPDEFENARVRAARLLWSSIVAPRNQLKREGMLMSKNWMNHIWSWDHCFNAMALAYGGESECAWDQFIGMFDFQAPNGQLPDSMDAYTSTYAFVKPPVHGWAFARMMKTMPLDRDRLAEAYGKLAKWTQYWLVCRDSDRNGLCEYDHGNDSGWDNSTVFLEMPPLETPELAAYLTVQMDVLADLAARLGLDGEAAGWKAKADAMAAKATEILFDADGAPRFRRMLDGSFHTCDSMLLRMGMILGGRLPAHIREKLLAEVSSEKFLTRFGLATESPSSGRYDPDGYWRGPIWAPEMMIAIDGVRACGDEVLARELALRFCRMCDKGGFAENFDALTGAPLRDKAYTWTASAFLVVAHELEGRK